MTKHDIINSIYKNCGLTRKDIVSIVDETISTLKSEILATNTVKIAYFGNFQVKKRAQRVGRNPKTGELIPIKPRHILTFKPSSSLKNKLNEK